MTNPRRFEVSCATTMEALRDLFGPARAWHGTQATLVGELSRRSGLGEPATLKVVTFLLGVGVLSKFIARAPRRGAPAQTQWKLEMPDAQIVKGEGGSFRVE